MKHFIKLRIALLVFTFAITLNGCKKEESKPISPIVFNPGLEYETITDQDGNVYKTIIIGTQTWMVENLRTIHYRNGETIPKVTDKTVWSNLTTDAYSSYNNTTDADSLTIFGGLYNWYAATDSRNLAPEGWHIPTHSDWVTLINYLGGDTIAGGKMKEIGTKHWLTPNGSATNESGFSALPSGYRHGDGSYYNLERGGSFWTNEPSNNGKVWQYDLSYFHSRIGYFEFDPKYGFSIRCVKD
jgi:uncharacterized protein (TIGR02145 family)